MNKVIKFANPVFGKSGEFNTKVNGRPFIFKEPLDAPVEESMMYNVHHQFGEHIMNKIQRGKLELTQIPMEPDYYIDLHTEKVYLVSWVEGMEEIRPSKKGWYDLGLERRVKLNTILSSVYEQ